MSVSKQTIKRLERKIDELSPKERPLKICFKEDGRFYIDDDKGFKKSYKTLADLKKSEGINDNADLFIVEIVKPKITKQDL